MAAILEREIKLRFESPEAARTAVLATGASPVHSRRLQEDCLLDTADEILHRRRCVLRVRMESGDGTLLLRILEELGFSVWFRYQKYREEFALDDVIVAVDETPVGTFVEIEGGDRGITGMAVALGRTPADYVLDSYRGLFIEHCRRVGQPPTHMLFAWE
jgi:adenylate cyclase class 2